MNAAIRRSALAATAASLLLALGAAFPIWAQSPNAATGLARASVIATTAAASARDELAGLRFESVVSLPDTLTLAELARGVPLVVQAVTRDGRPLRTAVSWRIVSGEATRIAADPRTDVEGYAAAMLGQEPLELLRPGRVVIEARTRLPGAARESTLRLSAVVVRK